MSPTPAAWLNRETRYSDPIDPDGLEAEARSLAPCFQREIDRRFADRRRQDAVLFAGERRRGERRTR